MSIARSDRAGLFSVAMETYSINFSAWREVDTKFGPRQVRSGAPTDEFFAAWRAESEKMKLRGFVLSKSLKGEWQVSEWRQISPEEAARRAESFIASRAAESDAEIPVNEPLEYLPYQRAGIVYAAGRPNSLIADEMGLGKTIQALGVINVDSTIQSVIIICPASLRLNWEREARKWLVRDFSIGVVDGGQAKNFPREIPDILIINYDVVSKHSERLAEIIFDAAICDEAHYLKNLKTKRTKATLAIKAGRWIFLSGTPILNKPVELFPLLTKLDPEGLGKNFMSYGRRYCKAHKTRFGWDFSGASNMPELQTKLREKFMIRRLKSDVLKDLPPKRHQVIEVSPNKKIRLIDDENLLVAEREEMLTRLRVATELAKASDDDAEYRSALEALRVETRVTFANMAGIRKAMAIEKIPYVVEHLESALENGPVVCFAHHRDVVAGIAAPFGDRAVTITGETSMIDRQRAVDDFQSGAKDLFVGNLQAAGVGITLVRSSHVLFAEISYVPAELAQAADRVHRIGQTNSVLIQYLMFAGSIDANMARSVVEKLSVIDKCLDDDPERAEFASVIVEPKRDPGATESLSRTKLKKAAASISAEQNLAIHDALRLVSAYCDGAFKEDGRGFNKFDTMIGKALASEPVLTSRQAALGLEIVRRYRRQVPAELMKIAINGSDSRE